MSSTTVMSPVTNIGDELNSCLAGMCFKPLCSLVFLCAFWTYSC